MVEGCMVGPSDCRSKLNIEKKSTNYKANALISMTELSYH